MLGQVPHDEEVGIEAHGVDDAEFVFQAFTYFGITGAITVLLLQAFFTQFTQIGLGSETFGDVELGQVVAFFGDIHVAAFGDH